LHELIVWIQDVAIPKLGWFGMFLVATADTSFIPLPELSDLLVVTGAARHPGEAWKFVLGTALGSVVGCQMAYEVARRGGEKLATRFIAPSKLLKAEMLLARYGFLAIALPALSPPPMPFKGFVLAAGIFAMPRARFAATVFLARGLRYVIWSVLGVAYGDEAIGWVAHLDVWAANHPGLVIGFLSIMGFAFVYWWRSHHDPLPVEQPPST
jgi:membrane protein YqaA with SNARE-associated domain